MDFVSLEKRHLPYAGGIRDQPADMMMDWRTIFGVENKWRKEKDNDDGYDPNDVD